MERLNVLQDEHVTLNFGGGRRRKRGAGYLISEGWQRLKLLLGRLAWRLYTLA